MLKQPPREWMDRSVIRIPISRPRVARLLLPGFELVLQFSEPIGLSWVVDKVVKFVGVGIEVVQFKSGTMDVRRCGSPTVNRQFVLQCHLPRGRGV